MNKYVIGIDPGVAGGIAFLDSEGNVVDVTKMPDTRQGILDLLRGYQNENPDLVCYLEDVGHGMPGQSSRATAVFARHCGHLEMALLALSIPTNTVTPQKWQKSYQLGKSSEYAKSEWKRKLKEKSQQLFPQMGKRITLATCDALLIAEYGRMKEK